MDIFISGVITGFSVAAPIGPISLMCINNILAQGTFFGFVTGLGASTADMLYGLIAALGISAVIDFSSRYHGAIRIAGGVLIILIGLHKFFLDKSAAGAGPSCGRRSILSEYSLVFTGTLSNPFTVCFFLSVFSAFGGKPSAVHSYGRAFGYAAGIFAGTALWWLILSVTVGAFNKALTPKAVMLIKKFSAVLIAGIGVYALARPW